MEITIRAKNLKLQALSLMIDALNKWYGNIKIEEITTEETDNETINIIKLSYEDTYD